MCLDDYNHVNIFRAEQGYILWLLPLLFLLLLPPFPFPWKPFYPGVSKCHGFSICFVFHILLINSLSNSSQFSKSSLNVFKHYNSSGFLFVTCCSQSVLAYSRTILLQGYPSCHLEIDCHRFLSLTPPYPGFLIFFLIPVIVLSLWGSLGSVLCSFFT